MMFRASSFRADPTGWIGAGIMIVFAAIAGSRWHSTGLLFFALNLLRDLVAACLLVTRRVPCSNGIRTPGVALLAYISSALPLFYLGVATPPSIAVSLISDFLAIGGYALSALAMIELGGSFGVSPANRGWVTTGPYRFIRHPMYFGYAMAELGFIVLNPRNAFLLVLSTMLYLARAAIESRKLKL